MSDSETRTRTRRKHHKVATGCANCKKRRVKCDEAKNGCQRCAKANLFCPGYSPPRARIFEPSARSEASGSEGDVPSIVQSQTATAFPLTFDRGIDLRYLFQTALLDSFLTTWLPHGLVQDYTNGRETDAMVPMSAWPLVAWKLAKRKEESFVAHALLCLTLCVIGSQTGNLQLVAEAARHYARVLHQFQAQVSLLAKSGYSAKQDEHVASLAAAGFCCSQVEYILQSWTNGDRHLQGMASLLQACGPACLRHEDTRSIFYDHYLLWNSCSITHRQTSIYSQVPWTDSDEWLDLPSPCRALMTTAARLPPLLEEYDNLGPAAGNKTEEVQDLLQRLCDIVVDLEYPPHANNFITRPYEGPNVDSPYRSPSTPVQVSDDSFVAVVMAGYSSAFIMHAGIAVWEIILAQQAQDSAYTYPTPHFWPVKLTDDHLREGCQRHLAQICQSVDELANHRFGMITASPLLFLLDSAWLGYKALQDFCGYDLDPVRPWFARIGSYVTSTGYRPLREPWLVPEFDQAMAGMMDERDVGTV